MNESEELAIKDKFIQLNDVDETLVNVKAVSMIRGDISLDNNSEFSFEIMIGFEKFQITYYIPIDPVTYATNQVERRKVYKVFKDDFTSLKKQILKQSKL